MLSVDNRENAEMYDAVMHGDAFASVDYTMFCRPYFEVFSENGKCGLVESHSRAVVVKPVFDDIAVMYDLSGSLIDGIINIKDKGEWCLYRLGRGYPVSPHFRCLGHLHEGVRHVSYHGKLHGFVDANNKIILPFVYADAKSFSEGLCAVKWIPKDEWDGNDGWGYIDRDGKIIIGGKYTDACKFHAGYARVQMADENFGLLCRKLHLGHHLVDPWNWGIIDKTGATIMPCKNNLDVVRSELSRLRNPAPTCVQNEGHAVHKDDIAIARDHVFVRNAMGAVIALNSKGSLLSSYEGTLTASWRDIRSVAAGFDHVVGLTSQGELVSTGNTKEFSGSSTIRSWRNIVMVDACEGHVAAVMRDGRIEIATETWGYEVPVNYSKELREIRNAKKAAVGWLHAAILLTDGTVRIVGECDHVKQCDGWKDVIDIDVFGCYYSPTQTVGLTLSGRVLHSLDDDEPDSWHEIVSVSCGNQFIVGLDKNGLVFACGRNDQGQCDVADWPKMICAKGDFFRTVAIDTDGWIWMTPVGKTQYNIF